MHAADDSSSYCLVVLTERKRSEDDDETRDSASKRFFFSLSLAFYMQVPITRDLTRVSWRKESSVLLCYYTSDLLLKGSISRLSSTYITTNHRTHTASTKIFHIISVCFLQIICKLTKANSPFSFGQFPFAIHSFFVQIFMPHVRNEVDWKGLCGIWNASPDQIKTQNLLHSSTWHAFSFIQL